MAIDINEVRMEGRLGADPDTRIMPGGSTLVTARIAVQDDYKDRNQQWQKRTYWISVSAFGQAAKELAMFRRGERIAVFGKWTVDEVTKGGEKNYYNKLMVQHVRGTERRFPEREERETSRPAVASTQRSAPRSEPPPSQDFDDDIPF